MRNTEPSHVGNIPGDRGISFSRWAPKLLPPDRVGSSTNAVVKTPEVSSSGNANARVVHNSNNNNNSSASTTNHTHGDLRRGEEDRGLAYSRWAGNNLRQNAPLERYGRTSPHRGRSPPRSRPRSPTSIITPAPAPASPKNAPSTIAQPSLGKCEQELDRFLKIVVRLNWKLAQLAQGYHHALDAENEAENQGSGAASEAQIMFKLDFYEYYMLIERALVRLLAVFEISVSNKPRTLSSSPDKANRALHSYHQNILEALDDKQNPLHAALGTGPVRSCLSRAKDLRNRWKYTEEGNPKTVTKLADFDVENTLMTILAGLDQGYLVARRHADELSALSHGHGDGISLELEPMTSESWADMMMEGVEQHPSGWEFMMDAMDWESV